MKKEISDVIKNNYVYVKSYKDANGQTINTVAFKKQDSKGKLQKNNNWPKVNAYIWKNSVKITGDWPGVIMPSDGSPSGWNSYTVNTTQAEPLGIIFSNNGSSQTGDLLIPTGQSEVWFDGDNSQWVTV